MGNIIFKEIQHFRQKWLLIAVASIILIFTFQIIQIVTDEFFGEDLLLDILLLLLCCIPVGLVVLIYYARLTTVVRIEGIYYKFFPLHWTYKIIKWEQIKTHYIREYNPVKEYSGWRVGLFLFGKNKAYTVTGNQGLQVELKNGSQVLLGTRKPDELMKIIVG